MDLENLSQFNKRLFKKFFGLYISRRRSELKISIQQAAAAIQTTEKEFKSIESGQSKLTQGLFDRLCVAIDLDASEIINIGRITQVQHLLKVYKEIDGQFP